MISVKKDALGRTEILGSTDWDESPIKGDAASKYAINYTITTKTLDEYDDTVIPIGTQAYYSGRPGYASPNAHTIISFNSKKEANGAAKNLPKGSNPMIVDTSNIKFPTS